MKRLLLPLLAAIALPTAVNAFPFGNNLEIENKVGEKTLIKGKTVSIQNLYKKDLINKIDKQIGIWEAIRVGDYSSMINSKSALKSRIIKEKSFDNISHVALITFTPVYIDLNNNKFVGREEMIVCFNSKLNNSFKRYWKSESSKSMKELIKKGLLMDKVCKKFAKF